MRRRDGTLAARIGDELRFVKTFATSPLKMGTFTPSGRALAEAMVDHSTIDPAGWTLEIGPGTGAVTQVLIDRGVRRSALSASNTMLISAGCSSSGSQALRSCKATPSISTERSAGSPT